ncbi:hypothetical protein KP79_PYT22018 [Mizuhopecten yessoensis]|uniref:Uncharacterized protein n=1 Tax=Mizuhopecten yessoensis TaxID=6573 RepID=A0A210Q0P9_MIZYE|nr:hypothetical protein KP79_PYT22018 [Mizuhopecten yessoensis]
MYACPLPTVVYFQQLNGANSEIGCLGILGNYLAVDCAHETQTRGTSRDSKAPKASVDKRKLILSIHFISFSLRYKV